MSTLRVDNIKSRTGTVVTVPETNTLAVTGIVSVTSSGSITNAGTLTNTGDVDVTGSLSVTGGANFNNPSGIITTGTLDINTLSIGNINSTGVITATGIHIDPVGAGVTYSEDLVVAGNARVTGILSIGTSSIVLNSSDNSIKLSSDSIIRRDDSTGDIRFLDSGGNLKKIIANEIRVGSGSDATLIKRKGGKVVFEDTSGEQVAVAKTWTSIGSGVVTTLSANTQYLIDTSSGVTTTYLPASPQLGEYIVIADSSGSFGINTCFIVQNDSATGPATYIQGSLEYLEADVQYAHATLTYTGISSTGWLVK